MRMLGTHKLKHPIVLETKVAEGGEAREEELKPAGFCVVMRRPKGKDLLIFDDHKDAPMAGVTAMIARISNLDAIEIANLDAEDFEELGNLLDRGTPSSPSIGATA